MARKQVSNGEIKIEHGVPAPPLWQQRGAKFPFAAMKPGDSFFVPAAEAHISRISARVWALAQRNPGQKYTCRTVDGGTRVWRVS